jgi:hypothetical protein
MLVSAVIDRCLQLFAEETTTPNYLSRAEILEFYNNCNEVLTEHLDCFVTTTVLNVLESDGYYELPDSLRTLKRVRFEDDILIPSSVRQYDDMDDKWWTREGDPVYYAIDVVQRNHLYVYKKPPVTGSAFQFTSDDGVCSNITSSGDTWTFTQAEGVVIQIQGGSDTFTFVDADGTPYTGGVMAEGASATGNLTITYSHYITDQQENDILPAPYVNGINMYVPYVMAQMYLVEAVEQDWTKVEHYLRLFAQRSGIELTKLWTPERQYAQEPYEVKSSGPGRARLPDDYYDG